MRPRAESVVADLTTYDWRGRPATSAVREDRDLRDARRRLHAAPELRRRAGQTRHLRGLIEKIPYLVDLGVSAVELLPVFAFDEQDAPAGLPNDWGYQPVSFFAPHQAYSSRPDPLAALDEFRTW
jgi:glycogen operon protein